MTMFGSQWLANAGSGYEIDQSIRFNNDDSPTMSRSFGTPTDQNKFTYAFWMKSTSQANGCNLSVNVSGGVTWASMNFNGGNMAFYDYTGGSANIDVRTTFTSVVGKFQDYSAWYHVVFVYDSDQGTDTNRIKFYINGVQFPVASLVGPSGGSVVWPSSGFNSKLNTSGNTHVISDNVNGKLDGYMAEIYFIDGQALDATSFGEFNTEGVFVPIAYSGAFGDNGFFIDGRDSSDLGDDESGNGNDFSTSGLAANDQVIDSPTNNMPVLNFLSKGTGTLSDGNLQYTGVSGNWSNARVNLLVPDTGKWALRMKSADSYQQIIVGLCAPDSACPYTDIDVNGVTQIRYNTVDGNFVTRVTGSLVNDTGAPTTAAQTFFQLLFDMDNGKIGVAADDATSGTFADISTYSALDLNGASLKTARQPFVQAFSGVSAGAGVIIDAGQSGWTTTVTGFKNLILANLDAPTITDGSEYFHSQLYTGNGSSGLAITNDANAGDFEPDLLIIAPRSNGDNKVWFDDVRGTTNRIKSNSAAAADVDDPAQLTFESDGFDLDTTDVNYNGSGRTYVAWQWKKGATPGFDIVQYTGNKTNRTISHSLGVAPEWIVIKDYSNTESWVVGHNSIGWTKNFFLNLTNAEATSSSIWQDTAPTSSVFSIGTSDGVNKVGSHIAYLWASVAGFSKFGSYTGNGDADGTFVTTDFLPAFVMVKRADSADNWVVIDSARNSFNATNLRHYMDTTNADITSITHDFVSNGFKLRASDGGVNASGGTYVYMAFAQNPFGGSGLAPVTGGFMSS